MIQTFSFRTEISNNRYQHTIYSVDIASSIEKWVRMIEDIQGEVYSFSKSDVENIKHQFLNNQLGIQLEKQPYFLTFKVDNKIQVVNIEKVKNDKPDFIAKLTFLTTEQGGRKGYAISGYRPHVKFDERQEMTSGEQLFVDKDKVFPGEMAISEIRIVSPHFFEEYLFPGQRFELCEGLRVVAHGQVLEVINLHLKKIVND